MSQDRRTKEFCRLLDGLDPLARHRFDLAFRAYRRDPKLVRFELKCRLSDRTPIYGAEAGQNLRALAMRKDDVVYWFWLGTHEDYDRILKDMRGQ
jgi:hypothetical protein